MHAEDAPQPSSSAAGASAHSGAGGADAPPPVKQRRKPGRVPVSCAECRRLKLRCDRKVPCETCVKRGCSAICPEGALTTGNRSNRLAFADAEELQKKVEGLRDRVKQLEGALRKLQADVSDVPHPLLVDSTDTSNPPEQPRGPLAGPSITHHEIDVPPAMPREDEDFIGAFGTLTLGLRGEARYYGSTARSEFLVHAPRARNWDQIGCKFSELPRLSRNAYEEALKGYDQPCEDPECRRLVFELLPSLSDACKLCEMFIEHGEYFWQTMPRAQLYDEILSVMYRSQSYLAEASEPGVSSFHAAGVLYMVFSLASLLDPEQPPCSSQAKEYMLLSRLALRCGSPVEDTTLWAIQALIYQGIYMQFHADTSLAPHFITHHAWVHLGLAVKLGYSIGLHVKSSKWQLDEEASQRRGSIFWQLFVQDTWLSFSFGRPPSINLAFVDCEFPKDPQEHIDSEGHHEWGYHPWEWQYTKLLHTAMSTAFGAKVPQYTKILELDRKVRDFPVPWSMRPKCGMGESPPPTRAMLIQRFLCNGSKEFTLLNLHRPYFAQALADHEHNQDLLRHRYAPSVLAIYRSAWRLIEGLRETHKRMPFVVERWGLGWSTAMSGAIIMCLLVTRAPTSSFAPASLHELDRLCELFQRCAGTAPMAAHNLEVVLKLQRQAHDAATRMEQQDRSSPALSELDRLGGKTHLIASDPAASTGNGAGPSMLPPNVPSPAASCTTTGSSLDTPAGSASAAPSPFPPLCGQVQEHIHPIIVSDMQTFEGMAFGGAMGGSGSGGLGVPAGTAGLRSPAEGFNFDLSDPFPLPIETGYQPDYQTLHEVSGYFGPDYFGVGAPQAGVQMQAMHQPSREQQQQQQQYSPGVPGQPMLMAQEVMGMPMSAPVLDATWQSFVEQLGF